MLRVGLIGLPATGKTTLFNLLTRTDRSAAGRLGRNEARIGAAAVPDERLDRLTDLFEPQRQVAATVTFADIAGAATPRSLVDVGAYREADALLHVVRAFRAADVPHVAGAVDAARDAQAVEDELILADLEVAERRLERLARDRKKGAAADNGRETDALERCRAALEDGVPIRALALDRDALRTLRGFQFLSAKPLLLAINLDEEDVREADGAATLVGLDGLLSQAHVRAVPVCARIELEIAQLDPEDARLFLADLGLQQPGLQRIVRAAYDLLGYISFFTVGKDECRAWSVAAGSRAPEAAGAVHTDMQRGFIRAEVVGCADLLESGSLATCRTHGELRLEGKDYVVQNGDVINFRFAN